MFLLVFVVLLGTVVTVNSGQPEVEMFTDIVHVDDVGAENGNHIKLVCIARGFITSDIILYIKKNGFIQSNGDGVKTSGVQPDEDKTYWRRDHVIIPRSEVSNYSCEVVHAASHSRVEKVLVPGSDEGRIISSKFIETTPPEVKLFAENSEDEKNVFLLCEASGFYPHNITVNMKKNGRILTRKDGLDTSDVRPNGDDGTFQIRHRVEIIKSDKSDYRCEVSHAASDTNVKKVWDHQLPPPPPPPPPPPDTEGADDNIAVISGAVVGGILVLVLVLVVVLLVLKRRPIRGTAGRHRTVDDSAKPEVKMEIKNWKNKTKIVLLCLVKGFFPKDIILNMKKNGRILREENGVLSSGVHVNEDGVFQRTDRVEVLKSEVPRYSCEIIHAASDYHVERFWDSGNTANNDEVESLLEESENVLVEI